MVVEKRPTKSTLRPLHPWKLSGIKHLLVCRAKLNSASWHIYHKINNTKNSLPYHWKLPNIKHFLVCWVKLSSASWHIFHGTRNTENSKPLQEEFEDTKGVIRICISKKNRQHNGQKKKYKRTNNDQQNIQKKLKIQ